MIKYIFDQTCFIDLQDEQGKMMGCTEIYVIDHLTKQQVNPEDYDDEITEQYDNLKPPYETDELPQVYFKKLQVTLHLLVVFSHSRVHPKSRVCTRANPWYMGLRIYQKSVHGT